MDKYNIISITTNLDDLKTDMARWCMLPYELRMRSIDDCRRLYNGMSVIDLYNHLKETILKGKDVMTTEPDNLIRESVATEYDKYEELLAQSKELQKSPYIVILDPDIKDIDELNNKYYSYYLLNDNNKQLSDTYSWKIWGRNIYSMYKILAAEIYSNNGENDVDNSNLIKVDESNTFVKIEECVSPIYDFFNEAMLDNDVISMYKYRKNLTSKANTISGLLESMVVQKNNICIERKFDTSILPKSVPWFTANESAEISDKINVDKFYSELKEELKKSNSEEKVLGYGWNPSVPLNILSSEYARKRHGEFFNKVDLINLYNLNVKNISPEDIKFGDIYPIFFVFGYDKLLHEFTPLPEYTKVGVVFPQNMSKVYTFDGIDDTFKGFKEENIYSYNYIDIVVFFIDNSSYLNLYNNIVGRSNDIYQNINFNSIFKILNRTLNKLSPDNLKIIYSRYINMLLRITNIDTSEKVSIISQNNTMNDNMKVFKVFTGHSMNFTRETAKEILFKIKVIANNTALTTAIKESVGEDSDELVQRLTPIACIKQKK